LNDANLLSFNQLNYCQRTAVGYIAETQEIVDFPITVHNNPTALWEGFYQDYKFTAPYGSLTIRLNNFTEDMTEEGAKGCSAYMLNHIALNIAAYS